MTKPDQTAPKKKGDLWRILPGLIISIAAVAILASLVNMQDLVRDVRAADYRYLILATVLFLVSLVARAYGWRAIMQDKISLSRTFWTMNEGYFLNNVLPFRMGEIGRALLLDRTTRISFWEALPTIVIERIIDVAFSAGILLVSLPYIVGAEDSQQIAYIVIGFVAIGFLILFSVVRNKNAVLRWFDKSASRWTLLHKFGRERLASLLEGASALSDLKRFLRVLFWMGSFWGLTILLFYALLLAFIPEAKLVWASFSLGALAMGVATPASPGNIGVYEIVLAGALQLVGIPISLAVSFAVVAHSLFLVFTLSFGGYALKRDGTSLFELYRQLRSRSTKI
ncbi:MAG: flippase-like domain-containing protein [Chloroflexi bacterium]|nr:flippase-like domain-containing protein [Chloroflexota bacterium]